MLDCNNFGKNTFENIVYGFEPKVKGKSVTSIGPLERGSGTERFGRNELCKIS